MKKATLFITGGGTATALSILKGIKKQSHYTCRAIAGDLSDFVSGKYLFDDFYAIPSVSKKADFINAVKKIIHKEHVDIVIPIIDFELPLWSEMKEQKLFPDTLIVVGNKKSLSICQDKLKTIEFFERIGVPTMRTYQKPEEIKNFPVFIKPRHFGRASINAFRIDNREDLFTMISKMKDNHLLSDYIEGEEYTVDCLATLEGKFITGVVRQRIETKNGLCTKGEVKQNAKILKYCKKIVEELGLPGACNIQLFKKGNQLFFFEVNPRFAGTHAFSIEAGLNSIEKILDMWNGKEVKSSTIHINNHLKMIRYWDEIIMDGKKVYTPDLLRL